MSTAYRDETNGCYVTRSSESILGGSPVVPSPCGCPERSRPAVSCPPCSYRACIGMGRINGSVRGFEVRSNGLCVQSHVAPRDVCSTVHGSPRRNNLLVRMVSYRYRCGLLGGRTHFTRWICHTDGPYPYVALLTRWALTGNCTCYRFAEAVRNTSNAGWLALPFIR